MYIVVIVFLKVSNNDAYSLQCSVYWRSWLDDRKCSIQFVEKKFHSGSPQLPFDGLNPQGQGLRLQGQGQGPDFW